MVGVFDFTTIVQKKKCVKPDISYRLLMLELIANRKCHL
jgi:hypothetical protein